MASTHTSVPRGASSPALGAARACIVLTFGRQALAAASRTWPHGMAPAATWHALEAATANDEALASLRTAIESTTVGFRLLIAGPEADVYLARSAALACGAQLDEIALCVTERSRRRVHCAHCKTVTETGQPIGAVVPCATCARSLLIYHHFSRRTGAYLGFMVNAEEVA